ncbi:phytanoyl-CoA dioxygenase [Histoplasma ohiense]|nr:phytanoyl-CoA dioxygenase [Histoplasma ohiense (nom. inval.)]
MTSPQDPTPYLIALQRDGFVVIPNFLPPSQLQALRTAASHACDLGRTGKWPHVRTVPKQFPPWPSKPPPAEEGGIWGVQHLMHPEMPGRDEFAKLYFSPRVLEVVEELVGVKKSETREQEPLTMELLNLLVAPTYVPFALRWHRDDIPTPPTLSAEDELAALKLKSPPDRPQSHAQYNIPLYDDASLIVVPGSHRRARTQAEREADPYEDNLPGQMVVKLRAGDAVFYDSNIWHRGVYGAMDPEAKGEDGLPKGLRLTVHGSVGLAVDNRDAAGGETDKAPKTNVRALTVLQHGVGFWVNREDADFNGLEREVKERAERMRKRLIEMGSGDGLGYALEG